MLLATSCYRAVPHGYLGAISISVSAPKWFPVVPQIKDLAPYGFMRDEIPVYVPKYKAKLAKLDARDMVNRARDLVYDRAVRHGLSDTEASEITPVLLCWEPAGQFCHRRMFADWVQDQIGLTVPEVKFTRKGVLYDVAEKDELYVSDKTPVQTSLF